MKGVLARRWGLWLSRAVLVTLAGFGVALAQTSSTDYDRAKLSRGGEGWEASAGIDEQGQAIALWVQRTTRATTEDRVWTRTHPPGGAWSGRRQLSRPLESTRPAAPMVRISGSGDAIAVWNEPDGVWASERSAQGSWSAARLLVAGAASPWFAMNAQGDAVLAWGSGDDLGGSTQLNVMRRQGGQAWQAPEVIARGSHVVIDHAAIADDTADVVVTWETYEAYCGVHCTRVNYVLHAARAARGSTTWEDSGPLSGPNLWSHRAVAAVDPAGRAGVAFALDFQGVMFTAHSGPGSTWRAPALIYASTFAYIAGLATDALGNTTLAFLDDDGGGGRAVAIVGSLATGLWRPAVCVSGADLYVGQVMLAHATAGAAILAWTSGDEFFTHNVVRAAARRSTFSTWQRPRTVSPAGIEQPAPEAVAVNASGRGIIVFSAYDSTFTVHTEYAVTN